MVSPENHLSQIQVGTNIRIVEPQKIMVVTEPTDETFFLAATLRYSPEGKEVLIGEGTIGIEDIAEILPQVWNPEQVIEAYLRGYEYRFSAEVIEGMRLDITENILSAAQMPPIEIKLV